MKLSEFGVVPRLLSRLVALGMVGVLVAVPHTILSQTATWTGGGGDNRWNTPANWLIDGMYQAVPGEGTNASIGGGYGTVLYDSQMAAPSIASLDSQSSLLVTAPGFVVAGTGDSLIFRGSQVGLWITNGGAVEVPNGNVAITNVAALAVWPGGSLTVGGTLDVGGRGQSGNILGTATNFGGNIVAGRTRINPFNLSYTARLVIAGGSNWLGDVIIQRNQGASFLALGTEGLIISNGLVLSASLDVGGTQGNSFLTMFMKNGVATNFGSFVVRQITANRTSRFLQEGGLFVHQGSAVVLRGHSANNSIVQYAVMGGTNLVTGFVCGDASDTTGRAYITNAGTMYIGAAGLSYGGTLAEARLHLVGGVLGAMADWSSTVPMTLLGGEIRAADLDGVARDISLWATVSGSGALVKTGPGQLTLGAANTYSGGTRVLAGTLALTGSGSLGSGNTIYVGQGATLDASGVGGLVLDTGKQLAGLGTVRGSVTIGSGATLNPGTNGNNGSLVIDGSLTLGGDTVVLVDLPAGVGQTNDVVVVTGDLNVSGSNTLMVNGSAAQGQAFPIFVYGGAFNGAVESFVVSGVGGWLSNSPTTKTIYFVAGTAVRGPTNVVWVGNPANNVWDLMNTTNWSNNGVLDFFVNGDTVIFDDTGVANGVVTISGLVLPRQVLVNATGDYEFTGSGAIGGNGTSLVKTNTGKLTVGTLNTYTGPTVLGGGTLCVGTLANGNMPSAIGQAGPDPANIQFYGGKLEYTGGSVTIDRGMTFNADGGQIAVTNSATTVTVNGTLVGAGGLTKLGAGTLTLGAVNSYGGGTVIREGTLRVNQPGSAGTNTIVLDGGTLYVALGTDQDLLNNIEIRSPSTIRTGTQNNRIKGAVSGSVPVTVQIGSGVVLTFDGNLTNYTGTFNLGDSAGSFRFNSGGGNTCFGCPNATIDLGAGTATLLARNPGTMAVGALKGGPNTRVTGPGNIDGLLTWEIGSNTNEPSTVFEGTITDTSSSRRAAVTKLGPGKLTLTGSCTYTGPTEVREGTLEVNGSLGDTSVTVSGGVLSGAGSIQGQVTVQFGAVLAPGAAGIGQMTLNGPLTMDYGSTLWIEVDKTTGQYDSVLLWNWAYFGGATLVVSNVAGSFAPGDTFVILNAQPGMLSGYFETIVPATPGPNMAWDTSTLMTDGTLRVVSTVVPQPQLRASVSGGNLVLSGTGGQPYAMYYVLTSTNVTAPLSTWTPVRTNYFDGDGRMTETLPINSGERARFYAIGMPQ